MSQEPTIEDARATARGAVLDVIARTSIQTGLRASPAAEALLDAIMAEIQDHAVKWAFHQISQ